MSSPETRGPALVDVLIPVFNGEGTIEESLQTIQRQTLSDIRIVVVNDGSTDATAAILDRLAKEDPRILVVTQANGGIVDALNAGLTHCSAEFIARHDADDIAFPHRLEYQLNHLRSRPECIAISANAYHIDEAGQRTGSQTEFEAAPQGNAYRFPALEPYLMHPFLMVRREALQATGGFRHVLHAEDADLYWRLLEKGALENSGILGEYRIHANSITSKSALNGRLGAVYSQLAALSYLRRKNGKPDLTFSKIPSERFSPESSLAEIIQSVADQLDEEELNRLRLGSAAKFIELAIYRPYSPSRSDCHFIRDQIRRYGYLASAENYTTLCVLKVVLSIVLLKRKQYDLLWQIMPLTPMAYVHFLLYRVQRRRRRRQLSA